LRGESVDLLIDVIDSGERLRARRTEPGYKAGAHRDLAAPPAVAGSLPATPGALGLAGLAVVADRWLGNRPG
jgi:hypothetical protein